MADAPKVWLWIDEPHGKLVVSGPDQPYPESAVCYVPEKSVAAAEQRGYAQAVEDAAALVPKSFTGADRCGPETAEALNAEARVALRALTPSTPVPVVPKVKPLVWDNDPDGSWSKSVTRIGWEYLIRDMGGYFLMPFPWKPPERFATMDAAKAAAQADHEARVLSQLDTAPVTVQEAARVLLDSTDALRELAKAICFYEGDPFRIARAGLHYTIDPTGETVPDEYKSHEMFKVEGGVFLDADTKSEIEDALRSNSSPRERRNALAALRALAEQEGE